MRTACETLGITLRGRAESAGMGSVWAKFREMQEKIDNLKRDIETVLQQDYREIEGIKDRGDNRDPVPQVAVQ